MDKNGILKLSQEFVKKAMEGNEPGHDYLHVSRVYEMALKLAEGIDCDLFLVSLLALFHDLEDHKFASKGVLLPFLNSLGLEEETKKRILFILPQLSFSISPLLPSDFPIEGKIVADADRLDAMGAIGVARAFSYGGNKNRRMYGGEESSLAHFDGKLLVLDRYLHLGKSKEIAKPRMAFLKSFYAEFKSEVGLNDD